MKRSEENLKPGVEVRENGASNECHEFNFSNNEY